MTNSEKPRLALKTGRWFAAPATNKAKAELSETRFETGLNIPGYTLVCTSEIEALAPKLKVEGAKVLSISTGADKLDRSYGEITAADIEKIGTGPAKLTPEIALPKPPRGGKSGRRWIKAAARRQRVYGNQKIAA